MKKINFQNFWKFAFFVIFFASEWRSKSQFLPSLEPIDIKILPASIFFETSYPRKWIQIEIWTDEPTLNFDFKSLALSICRRPRFSKFPWHRITLRVGMMPSCSTSHLNDLRDFKNDSNAKNLIFQKFLIFSFFCHFFAFEWRSKSSFLPPLEPIEIKILPDGIFFEASYPRKWNKIEIWTDEPPSNFDSKSLALPICRRLGFSKFPWHRITLRVGMMPSCSTSHFSLINVFASIFL